MARLSTSENEAVTDAEITSAMAAFSPGALAEIDPGTRIAFMHPADFLCLAAPVAERIDSSGRTAAVQALMDAGETFSSLPVLEINLDGEDGYVQAHDGRHRAMEILSRGGALMPVVLEVLDGETGAPADPVDLEHLRLLHPQPHDEDDSYPGFDEEALEERLMPLAVARVMGVVMDVGAVQGLLEQEMPAPGR